MLHVFGGEHIEMLNFSHLYTLVVQLSVSKISRTKENDLMKVSN